MKLLQAVAALAAALAVVPANAAEQAPCNLAGAKRAMATTKLRMKLLGPDAARVAPSSADRVLCHDFTRDGRTDIAVTIVSGGTVGDVGFALFLSTPNSWQVALARSFDHLRFHWNGERFVAARSWHTRSFHPEKPQQRRVP
jgi:hypothetical protein